MSERKKRWLFQLGFIFVSCLIIEVVLRFMGYPPGDIRPGWLAFKPVDSLYVIHDFYTDANGVLVADSLYWAKEKIHINSNGFRGKEFSQLDTTKKKILFIGDSFTWGMSASPFQDSSFCDLLSKLGKYEIINTGIPAADPAQYEKIAQLYIPQIHPDFVFVIFFMGNDLMKEERTVIASRPFYYWTNAGAILADIDGRHFNNPYDAYNYLVNERYFLKNPHHWYEKIINKSALLSRLYSLRYRVEEKIDYETLRKHTDITKNHLKGLIKAANNANAPIKLVLVRERKEANMDNQKYLDKYADILLDKTLANYWLMPNSGKDYFRPDPDGHLNNAGHRLYYNFLKSLLARYFQGK